MSYIPTVWKRGDIVSSEKLNKLEQGVADATSETIIAEETDAWLEENIAQETGYALDSSLTMSNAAAPADKVGELKTAINDIITEQNPTNLLNPTNITTGKYWKPVNVDDRYVLQQSDNSAYSCAFIDVEIGKSYIATGISYSAYNGDNDGFATGIAKSASSNTDNPVFDTTATNNSYNNTDKTTTRLYFSWRHANYATLTFMINEGTTLKPFEPYYTPYTKLSDEVVVSVNNITPQVMPEEYTVDLNGNGDYTSFTDCLVDLKDNDKEKIIYIKAGVYDVFEEIGGATFAAQVEQERQEDPDNYSWFDCSTVVPPNTKIIGIGEVVLEFKPTSSEITTQVMALLSPVNVIYDIYMENITIDCDNCRYGIHDDTGHISGLIETRHIYKNVKIIKARTDGGMSQAFGCGMQRSQYMEFDCCDFESPDLPFSFHNKGTNSGVIDNTIILIQNQTAPMVMP